MWGSVYVFRCDSVSSHAVAMSSHAAVVSSHAVAMSSSSSAALVLSYGDLAARWWVMTGRLRSRETFTSCLASGDAQSVRLEAWSRACRLRDALNAKDKRAQSWLSRDMQMLWGDHASWSALVFRSVCQNVFPA
eukprot:2567419-Rhodomonas_salina.1